MAFARPDTSIAHACTLAESSTYTAMGIQATKAIATPHSELSKLTPAKGVPLEYHPNERKNIVHSECDCIRQFRRPARLAGMISPRTYAQQDEYAARSGILKRNMIKRHPPDMGA